MSLRSLGAGRLSVATTGIAKDLTLVSFSFAH